MVQAKNETSAMTSTFVTVVLLQVLVVIPSISAVTSFRFRSDKEGALLKTTLPTQVSAGAKPRRRTWTPLFPRAT